MKTLARNLAVKTSSVIRNAFLLLICAALIWGASSVQATRTHSDKATARRTISTTKTLASDPQQAAQIKARYGNLPMQFEANQGQANPAAKFIARGPGYTLSLLPNQAVLRLRHAGDPAHTTPQFSEVGIQFIGANSAPVLQGEDILPGQSNYFVGSHPAQWQANIATFAKVKYQALYPGIDLVYYGRQGQLEYDFVVAPRADARRLQMTFSGVQAMQIASNGQLILRTPAGVVRQLKPVIYQTVQGQRRVVQGRYILLGKQRVGFHLGKYDRTQPLVIDPILEYSTPMGGLNSDQGLGIAVDKDGNAYITGDTASLDFPVAGAVQAAKNNQIDAFVLKLNASGSAIVYSTYLGGAGTDTANGIAVDADGNAHVTGVTTSPDFPVTNGAVQSTFKGLNDAFITKLNAAGAALVYSSYLGGSGRDGANAIALDNSGSAYVTGRTDSPDLPATGLQTSRQGSLAFQSLNRGDAWTARQNGLIGSNALALAVNPAYPNIVFLSTNSGLYRTINEGTLWQPLTLPPANGFPFITTIAIHPKTPSILYAGGLGVYKSTDDGMTWTTKNNGMLQNTVPLPVNALAIDPKQPDTIYAGTSLGVYKTTDGGENWTAMNFGLNYQPVTPTLIRITELVIDPINTATVYAGTAFGIFKTTDGGAGWTGLSGGLQTSGQLPSEIASLVLDPNNPSILYASPTTGQGGVYKSLNGALSWGAMSNGLRVTTNGTSFSLIVNALATDPKMTGTLYGDEHRRRFQIH